MNAERFSFHTETSIIVLNIARGFNHGDTIMDTIIDTIINTTRIPVVETTGYVEIQFNNYKHIELF